jgi:hypothetical protein
MKSILVISVALGLSASAASAQYRYGTGSNSSSHSVSGYINPQGSYVSPHRATNPNSTQLDNYSTRGNYNPHTGTIGTRTPRY